MKQSLRRFFNKAASTLRKATVSLAAAFSLAGAAQAQDLEFVTPVTNPATYWKIEDYDLVIKVRECEPGGLCGSIHAYNPQHKKFKMLAAQLFHRTVPLYQDEFGTAIGARFAPESITDFDVTMVCGYSGPTSLKRTPDGGWTGTFLHPYQWNYYGIDVKQTDADTLVVKGYLPNFSFVKIPMTAKRVDPPPPGCDSFIP